MGKINLTAPNLNFVGKTAIAMVVIFLILRIVVPQSWGVSKLFKPE